MIADVIQQKRITINTMLQILNIIYIYIYIIMDKILFAFLKIS